MRLRVDMDVVTAIMENPSCPRDHQLKQRLCPKSGWNPASTDFKPAFKPASQTRSGSGKRQPLTTPRTHRRLPGAIKHVCCLLRGRLRERALAHRRLGVRDPIGAVANV